MCAGQGKLDCVTVTVSTSMCPQSSFGPLPGGVPGIWWELWRPR